MRKVERHFVQVLLTCVTLLLFQPSTYAHEEPPKTASEKAEREKVRKLMESHRTRTQSIWSTEFSDSGKNASPQLLLRSKFDRKGSLVEQIFWEGSDSTTITYLYDDRNNWLEELTYAADSLTDRTTLIYNRDGLIRQIANFDNQGGRIETLDYEYRQREGVIFVVKRDRQDSIEYTIRYSYDPTSDFRRQIEVIQSGKDGSLKAKVVNQFANDQRIVKQVFGSDGKLTHAFAYKYTPENEFSEIVKKDSLGNVSLIQAFERARSGVLKEITERDRSGAILRELKYIYEYYTEEP